MSGFINVNGSVKKVSDIFVNIDGEKKSVSSAWVNRDGVPVKIFDKGGKQKIYVLATNRGIYTSIDLLTWVKSNSVQQVCKNVKFLDGFFITSYLDSSSNLIIAVSKNGESWNTVYSIRYTATATRGKVFTDFAYGNGTLIAISSEAAINVYSKDNGMTWERFNLPSYSSNGGRAIIFDGEKFIIFVGNLIWTSSNGIDWTLLSTNLSGTLRNRVLFGTTGQNGNVYSLFQSTRASGKYFYTFNDLSDWEYTTYSTNSQTGPTIYDGVIYNNEIYFSQFNDRSSAERGWKHSSDVTKNWSEWAQIGISETTLTRLNGTTATFTIADQNNSFLTTLDNTVFSTAYSNASVVKTNDFKHWEEIVNLSSTVIYGIATNNI